MLPDLAGPVFRFAVILSRFSSTKAGGGGLRWVSPKEARAGGMILLFALTRTEFDILFDRKLLCKIGKIPSPIAAYPHDEAVFGPLPDTGANGRSQ